MRLFIAVELPKEIKELLDNLQGQLKASEADVKWVNPENIHLTLKFLGEIQEQEKDKIVEIITGVTKDKNSFSARLSGVGAFPKIDYPRVIWIGITQGHTELEAISKALEEKIAKIGIPKEDRPFSSHITLGRTRSTRNREKLIQGIRKLDGAFGQDNPEFKVTNITLFKSTLTPGGPIYETLSQANLKTT